MAVYINQSMDNASTGGCLVEMLTTKGDASTYTYKVHH